MTPGDARLEEALQWLAVAGEDLRLASIALHAEPPVIALALFRVQQAAEKAIKGFLVFHGCRSPLTHNLAELARPAVEIDSSLRRALASGLALTAFATRDRYPGEAEHPSLDEAHRWLRIAAAICGAIRVRFAPRQNPLDA